MRRITLWLLSTVAAVVLLFSYRTSTLSTGTSTVATDTNTGTGTGTGTSGGDGTYDGSSANTRFGPVQVRITVADGQITDVTVLDAPDRDRRDQEINSYALPILRDEALQAQSAQIDTVSGATYTSDGYRQSLQAAIDSAHL
jgi:uncharacterized protein with FMN-binding domain